jgi:transcription initiation factor TFIID subunit 6
MNLEKYSFKTFILTVASSLGIDNLDPVLAGALGPDVEYRLREIIQEAIKFMKHSKRETLTCSDVTHALALHNVEQLFGFSGGSQKPNRYVKVRSDDPPSVLFV